MHHFSSFQIHKLSCLAFTECLRCTCFSVFSSNGAQGVQLWQCCHSEAPWGQVLRFDKHCTKTHKHESHLQDLKVSTVPRDEWLHLGKRRPHQKFEVCEIQGYSVKLPTTASLIYFISHMTNNLVIPKPGSLVIQTIRQTDLTSVVSQRHVRFVCCRRCPWTTNGKHW